MLETIREFAAEQLEPGAGATSSRRVSPSTLIELGRPGEPQRGGSRAASADELECCRSRATSTAARSRTIEQGRSRSTLGLAPGSVPRTLYWSSGAGSQHGRASTNCWRRRARRRSALSARALSTSASRGAPLDYAQQSARPFARLPIRRRRRWPFASWATRRDGEARSRPLAPMRSTQGEHRPRRGDARRPAWSVHSRLRRDSTTAISQRARGDGQTALWPPGEDVLGVARDSTDGSVARLAFLALADSARAERRERREQRFGSGRDRARLRRHATLAYVSRCRAAAATAATTSAPALLGARSTVAAERETTHGWSELARDDDAAVCSSEQAGAAFDESSGARRAQISPRTPLAALAGAVD